MKPIETLRSLNKLIELFASVTGYKINEETSVLVDLGLMVEERQYYRLKWKEEEICYLGVRISASKSPSCLIDSNII